MMTSLRHLLRPLIGLTALTLLSGPPLPAAEGDPIEPSVSPHFATGHVLNLYHQDLAFAIPLDAVTSAEGDSTEVRLLPGALTRCLKAVATAIERPAAGPRLAISGIGVAVTPAVEGRRFLLKATIERIEAAFDEVWPPGAVELAVETQEPPAGGGAFEGYSVLGSFATRFNVGLSNRSNNVRLAADAVNDTTVAPGTVFSFNSTTGRRAAAKGYQLAGIYSGSRTVLGYGGGVCQVSTTVYNAALMAGMEIVERHSHSMSVPYVPWGRDATVSWGAADMRFRNTTKAPVVLKSWVDGDTLYVTLLGRRAEPDAPNE